MHALILAIALLAATPALAQSTNWTATPVPNGGTSWFGHDNLGNNWSGSSQRLPNGFRLDQLHGSDGTTRTCTSQRIGNQVVTNCY